MRSLETSPREFRKKSNVIYKQQKKKRKPSVNVRTCNGTFIKRNYSCFKNNATCELELVKTWDLDTICTATRSFETKIQCKLTKPVKKINQNISVET